MDLIEPQEYNLKVEDGTTKTYILSKFPAVQGREIAMVYVSSGLPKIGDYAHNQEIMLKLMNYVAVKGPNDNIIRLSTMDLINAHIKSFEDLIKIELKMMEYNCSFFRDGRISSFFEGFVQNVQAWITKILIDYSAQSSQKDNIPLPS